MDFVNFFLLTWGAFFTWLFSISVGIGESLGHLLLAAVIASYILRTIIGYIWSSHFKGGGD